MAEHPAVAESAVVSSLDPIQGEVRRMWRSLFLWVGTGKAGARETSRPYVPSLRLPVEGGHSRLTFALTVYGHRGSVFSSVTENDYK